MNHISELSSEETIFFALMADSQLSWRNVLAAKDFFSRMGTEDIMKEKKERWKKIKEDMKKEVGTWRINMAPRK
jgi:hypothetical protein